MGAKEVNTFMDGKDNRNRPQWAGRSRKQTSVWNGVKDPRHIVTFFQQHKSSFMAGFLLTIIVVLLLCIVSQIQVPDASSAPDNQTAVSYSAFVDQVEAGNVLATLIRGDQVSALLVHAPGAKTTTQLSAAQKSTQITDWSTYLTGGSSTWDAQAPADINAAQMEYTTLPAGASGQLMALLTGKQVVVTTQAPATTPAWVGMLLKFAPLLLLLFLVAVALRPRGRGRIPQNVNEHIARFTRKQRIRRFDGSALMKSREGSTGSSGSAKSGKASSTAFTPSGSAGQQVTLPPATTFADVAGIDEVRAELEEIVQFLRFPEKYDRLGARIPRGALLVGEPGTGKTLLARAVAGEAGVPFFSISASEFVEMFVGVGASRVRDLFAQARQAAPAVIFIDEIDAVGRKRSMKAMGNEERDQTLNQLLVELDGFDARQAVVVLAATNRVDILDKALLRPGRFDRHIHVALPDRAGRQAILQIHTAKTPLHADVSLERLARLTTGMSGADLANVVNEAALCAARKDLEQVTHECFEDALARVQLGALRPLMMTEAERRVIAYHEGGHALVAYHLHEADTVNRVTILPRGQSLGVTQFVAEEDRYNYSREMLMAKIAVGLGGRTAEELILGRDRVTTGAENDFQVVTGMARRMVTRWGMSDEVGVVFTDYDETGAGLNMRRFDPSAFAARSRTLALDASGQLVPDGAFVPENVSSFAMAAPVASPPRGTGMIGLVDREVKKILDEGHEMARSILREHFDQLERLADALMEREQLGRSEFEALLQD
jgi:cell division protease FtsH